MVANPFCDSLMEHSECFRPSWGGAAAGRVRSRVGGVQKDGRASELRVPWVGCRWGASRQKEVAQCIWPRPKGEAEEALRGCANHGAACVVLDAVRRRGRAAQNTGAHLLEAAARCPAVPEGAEDSCGYPGGDHGFEGEQTA